MQPNEPHEPAKPAPSLSDFSAKPRSADLPAPTPFHLYEPKAFARARGLTFPDAFIELRNPTAGELSAVLFLGPAPGSKPFRSRDDDDDDDDDAASKRVRAAAWAHQCSLFCKFIFPAGATLPVPRSLVSAFVSVKDGVVVSGMIPQLELPGDPNPPSQHPGSAPDVDARPFGVPGKERHVNILSEEPPPRNARLEFDGGVGDERKKPQ